MRNRLIKQKIITKDMRAEDVYGQGFNKWIDPCTIDSDNEDEAEVNEEEKEDEIIDQVLNHKNTDSESDGSDDNDDEVDVDKMMGLVTQEAEQKIYNEHD